MNISKLILGKSSRYVLSLLFVTAVSMVQTVSADIYSYVDSNGNRWLTNGSVSGKKQVKLLKRTPKKKRAAAPASRKYNGKIGCGSHQRIAKKTKPYMSSIRKYAKSYSVEEKLIRALIRQESCFNPKARSHAGAQGLMQLMPGTADMMGVRNAMNPKQNIRGGVKYLSRMLKRFGGNKELALAAYNAGPGAVDKYNGIPPYRETQNYVVKVMSEYQRLTGGRRAPAAAKKKSFQRSGAQKVKFTSYVENGVTVFQAVNQ